MDAFEHDLALEFMAPFLRMFRDAVADVPAERIEALLEAAEGHLRQTLSAEQLSLVIAELRQAGRAQHDAPERVQ